jgi:hypothetical protein
LLYSGIRTQKVSQRRKNFRKKNNFRKKGNLEKKVETVMEYAPDVELLFDKFFGGRSRATLDRDEFVRQCRAFRLDLNGQEENVFALFNAAKLTRGDLQEGCGLV